MEKSAPSRTRIYVLAYLSLFLISFAAAASYFAYDVVSPIGEVLERELHRTSTEINSLYSIYSVPVIFLVVFGGVLADKLGVRKAGVLFTAVFAVGAALTATGIFPVMLLGRLIFGVGAECFYVVMNKVVAKWFKNRTLAMAFGVNLFLCRAGTYLAFYGLPWMVKQLDSWRLTLWVVAGLCAVSLIALVIYAFVDKLGDKEGITAIVEQDEKFQLTDVFRLPLDFWVISLLCMLYYSAIFPFSAVAPRFFQEQYHLDSEAAGKLAGVLILISMCTTWLFGLLVDKVGKRATLMILGSLLMIPCHVAMAFTHVNPWIPMIALGVSFSLVPAALWPALPLMVKESQLGTAYGVIAMVQNIGLALFPIAAGKLRDSSGDYRSTMMMFSSLAVAGLVCAVWLKIIELRGGAYLDKKLATA